MSTVPIRARRRRVSSRTTGLMILYFVAGIAALFAIFPLYWIFISSLLTQHSAMDTAPHFWPDWAWSNYTRA